MPTTRTASSSTNCIAPSTANPGTGRPWCNCSTASRSPGDGHAAGRRPFDRRDRGAHDVVGRGGDPARQRASGCRSDRGRLADPACHGPGGMGRDAPGAGRGDGASSPRRWPDFPSRAGTIRSVKRATSRSEPVSRTSRRSSASCSTSPITAGRSRSCASWSADTLAGMSSRDPRRHPRRSATTPSMTARTHTFSADEPSRWAAPTRRRRLSNC